jgi:hypothetical protein
MVNENENTQPELNMVSEESTAPVAEPQAEPTVEPAETQAEPQVEPAPSTESASVTETSSETLDESSVNTYPSTVEPTATTEQAMKDQLAESQKRISELEQHNLYNQAQQEAAQYQQSLVAQGYSPQQAQYAAQQWMGTRTQQMQTEQNYQQQIQFKEGQYKASLHYGKQFNVDPEVLLKYQTPQEMETAARHMSEVRSLKEENARLKKGTVPAQKFDSNTAPADASSSEERLLDLYNSGVRNPETEAAARRAAGLG